MKACSIEGCYGKYKGLGFCIKHYARFKNNGDPLKLRINRRSPEPVPRGQGGIANVRICSVSGCGIRSESRGWCGKHYMRWLTHGDPLVLLEKPGRKPLVTCCKIGGCKKAGPYVRGLCGSHRWYLQRYGDPLTPNQKTLFRKCSVDGCERKTESRGYCKMHYTRIKDHGYAGEATPRRKAAGEGHVLPDGYIKVRKVMQHRLMMEERIGRRLFPFESVHHLNGIRSDNRPENLELWTKKHGPGQRVRDLVAFVVAHYKAELQLALTEV